jgi:tetratricopeptide (TPR) repeat protein
MDEKQFHRAQLGLFAVVVLFTLVVYALTYAPTISYWDCGEFIACTHILGIPHPPGTPLFVLIGRLFTLIPTSSDPSARVNVISVLTSAFAAGFAFLVLVRAIRQALKIPPGTAMARWQGIVALCGAISGSLFMAFSDTHWNNAVEAEVYGASMLLVMILIWMAVRWADTREQKTGGRYLVGISYLAMLSLGIHMTTFLVLPVIFLFIIMLDVRLRKDWKFWVTGIVLFMVVDDLNRFLISAGIWTLLSLIMAFKNRKSAAGWGMVAAIMVAGWIGYSNQFYLPIRSDEKPWIDENHPATFSAFAGFLERKQYGQTSMIVRMFDRRGTWANQFGDHPHMGFYRYWKEQYGFGGWLMLPVILLGFYGVYWMWRRAPAWGVMIFLLFLVSSLGLILYMNFADGTQYQRLQPDAYMEVRHRDYFFTPAYIVFGMMMGIGLAALAAKAAERGPSGVKGAIAIGVIAALLPLQSMADNWRGADRSRNYTPYDYAYDLLQSCKPNAILFTFGDNDTFPLWAIQEVYHVRKDVSIINLSLANTDWYVYQMKHQWGLPVTFTDDQILWTVDDPTLGVKRPKEPIKDPITGNRHYLFATRDGDRFVPVSMMVIEHVIMNNNWKRPVYFSSSPGDKCRLGLENHCRVVGQAFEVVKEDAHMAFDWPEMDRLMDSVYLYRSYQDPTIGLDDNEIGLAVAFPERMLALADHYRSTGDSARSEYWIRKAVTTFPFYNRPHEQLAAMYTARGDSVSAHAALDSGLAIIGRFTDETPVNRLYWYFRAQMADDAGQGDLAEEYMATAFWNNPNDGMIFNDYEALLARRGKTAEAARAAARYLTYYPGDQRARQLVNAVR